MLLKTSIIALLIGDAANCKEDKMITLDINKRPRRVKAASSTTLSLITQEDENDVEINLKNNAGGSEFPLATSRSIATVKKS